MHPTQQLPFPPLPRRVVTRPWEDLTSVIRRVAQKMGYADLRWVLRPEKAAYPIREASLPVLSDETDYTILSHLLQLEETVIVKKHTNSEILPTVWKLPPPLYFALFEGLALELFNTCWIDLLELLHARYPGFEEEILPDREEWEYADAPFVVLFHTLFTHWPTRFWAFLDRLYSTAPSPYGSSFTLPMDRCRKIFDQRLGRDAHFPWLWTAFEKHWNRFSRSDWYRKAAEEEASLVWQASKLTNKLIAERRAPSRHIPSQ